MSTKMSKIKGGHNTNTTACYQTDKTGTHKVTQRMTGSAPKRDPR